jgi:hypothetical protein
LRAQDKLPEALEAYRQSLTVMTRLSALDPDNVGWQHDLAGSQTRVFKRDTIVYGARMFAGDPQDRLAGAAQFAEQLRCLEERRKAFEKQQAILKERERAAYHRGILRKASLALVVILLVSGLPVTRFCGPQPDPRPIAAARTQAGRIWIAARKVKSQLLHSPPGLLTSSRNVRWPGRSVAVDLERGNFHLCLAELIYRFPGKNIQALMLWLSAGPPDVAIYF